VPGDSPVGYRLPLGSLPHVPPSQYPYTYVADPEPRGPLPDYRAQRRRRCRRDRRRKAITPSPRLASRPGRERRCRTSSSRNSAIGGAVRTALSVEPRDGRLCVFMPPVERVEDYLDLVAAAEARPKLGLPSISRATPPHDPRMNVIRVAPDPGVIEVNIHPASSWEDCVATPRRLRGGAADCRLGADKFMIDGKHTGTGGGNHVVVGGATRWTARSCAGPTCCAA
jgi:uncharacterized protein (DUF2126 family)